MIPDFKGHHFVEEFKPDEPPSGHYCERCGMKAALRPDGSTYFEVDRRPIHVESVSDALKKELLPRQIS